jgi:hypothetical protein
MKRVSLLLSFLLLSTVAVAQSQSNGCDPTATSCTGSNQNSGDITNPGTSNSASTQLGNSSASIASGITADPRSQVTQNADNNTTGTITGGNTSSGAAANGNTSSNDNRSSVGNVSSGPSVSGATSSSGGNTLATGPSTSSVGPVSSNAAGGAGGSGGAGGNAAAKGGNATQGQGQGQGQQQASTNTQGQGQSSALTGGNQRSALTGGNNAATTGSNTSRTSVTGGAQSNSNGQNVGNGQQTSIGGSSYSDNSRTLFIPPVVPPTPPSVVGIGQVIQTTLACGPLQRVEKTPIIATNFGIFHDGHQQQGVTYDLAPVVDPAGQPVEYRYEPTPNGDLRIIGSQATMFATVVAVSSAQSIALGGGSGASWGQGGGGSSGSMSQLVTNIQVRDCEVGFLRQPAPVSLGVISTPEPVRQTVIAPRRVWTPVKRKLCK